SVLQHHSGEMPVFRGRTKYLRGYFQLQYFLAVGITQDAHQSIIYFNEATRRRREEKALLNVVKQFSIAAFRFAAITDVFENVNGLQTLVLRSVNPRGRNEVNSFQDRMDKFIAAGRSVATEWACGGWRLGFCRQEGPH